MQRIYLTDRSYSVDNLPSEPSLLVELLDLCHNDTANFEMFSTAIKKDPSLTVKILQVANSPAYRQWNELTDIRRMLIVLGMTNIRNIVTTCAIRNFFANFTSNFNRNVQFIWLRSLLCANLAERIAKLIGYEKPGEAFLAGLMHQIGMLLLLLNREADYLPILDQYYFKTETFRSLEQEKLQIDHCELGAALIESWKLDSFIADAVHFQHAPAEELGSAPTLLQILAVASPLSSSNSARDNHTYREKAGLLFGLTEATVLDCLNLAVEKSKKMITDLGFSGSFYMGKKEATTFNLTQHESNRKKLATRVENIALSSSIGNSNQIELMELTKEIRTSFSILFNLKQLFFFKVDENQEMLSAVNDLEICQLDEIKLKIADKGSVLVKSFTERIVHASLSSRCSIADKQVIRLLDTDGAYFLPIYYSATGFGVLVLGISERELPVLQNKTPLLKLLGNEIAKKYFSFTQDTSQVASMTIVDFKKIAHEVSNPLTIINNYLYILGKKIERDHPTQNEIKFISEEIERVGNILLRAKDPEAPIKTAHKQVNINQLLTELDTLFNSSIYKTKQIESTLLLDKQIPTLFCPKDKLKQILINIIKNSVEALPDKGRIKITSRDNFYQNGQQYVEISIQDSGPGIDAKIMKNLFEPIISTKKGHSGLGLTIVNTLVQEISGHISCYSNNDYGTEFKILIPRKQIESEIEMKCWK